MARAADREGTSARGLHEADPDPDAAKAAAMETDRIAAFWQRVDAGVPDSRNGLSLDRIAAAGVALADADGLAAVSMARVAASLGYSTMALYRHVAGKDELLLLMFNAAFDPLPPPDPAVPWQHGILRWAQHIHTGVSRSPWAAQVNPTGLNTPRQVEMLDHGLQILEPTGLSYDERAAILLVISGHVFSHARMVADLQRTYESGNFGALFTAPDLAERHPALAGAIASGLFDGDPAEDEIDDFRFGVELLIDGVERRIDRGSLRSDTGPVGPGPAPSRT